jgi:hypothetical protein
MSLGRNKGTLRRTLGRKPIGNKRMSHQPVNTIARNAKLFEKPKEKPGWWTLMSWGLTCCFPKTILSSFGIPSGSQQAWREKVALCLIALILMGTTLFFLLFFSVTVCPKNVSENTIPVNLFGILN